MEHRPPERQPAADQQEGPQDTTPVYETANELDQEEQDAASTEQDYETDEEKREQPAGRD